MQYYLELTLLESEQMSMYTLLSKCYQQVHIALVDIKNTQSNSQFGISFPKYRYNAKRKIGFLGDKLRLFASTKAELDALNIGKFLERLSDYVHIKSIAEVPKGAKAVSFVRKSVKGDTRIEQEMLNKIERLTSRDAKWFEAVGKTLEQCLEDLSASKPSADSTLPFIWMESQETKKRDLSATAKFPLFIERIEADIPQNGSFNCYGLAVQSENGTLPTVPDF